MADTHAPDEARTVGPSAGEIIDLARELREQWTQRNAEYEELRNAVRGEHWEGLGVERPRSSRYSLTANYQKSFVAKSIQMLVGQLPAIMVAPPRPDDEGRRLGERIEGVLYDNWERNEAHRQLFNLAWNQYTLRRGYLYYWWDAKSGHVRWRSIVPDNLYPALDGEDVFEAVYVTRRLTRALHVQYPQFADQIHSDDGEMHFDGRSRGVSAVEDGITDALSLASPVVTEYRPEPIGAYTTVLDYFDEHGAWVRIMGDAEHRQRLNYPTPCVPFIEFRNGVNGNEAEPQSMVEDLVGLNVYYNQLLSQHADIIRKTADPPIIAENTGQDPAKIRSSAASGDGSVIPIKQGGSLTLLTWPEGSMPDIRGQMEEVRDVMFDLSGKPRSAFGQTITNQSGVVTNLTLTPTLQSNELDRTMWSWGLERLNRCILEIYEDRYGGRPIRFKAERRRVAGASVMTVPIEGELTGSEIAGWTRNTMKWPSAIRVDDPVYVDTVLKQAQAQPQLIAVYDALEMLGFQDVEARIDRIKAEREDPRLHPEVLEQTVSSLSGLAGLGTEGFDGLGAAEESGGAGTMPEDQTLNMAGEPLSPGY